jgi:acetolactate synthase-1/3 small subunit
METIHNINIKFTNRAGNIIRIALVLERRGYSIHAMNIYTLNDATGLSEMKIELKGDHSKFEQIKKQISKLIDVIEVSDVSKATEAIPNHASMAMAS